MAHYRAVLGISAFYHDSAAALVVNGEIVAAAQEERFTRIKHDPAFPIHAIRYVLAEAGLTIEEVAAVAFYDKPFLTFERLLETYHAFAPAGLKSFLTAMPGWIKDKLFTKRLIRQELAALGELTAPVWFTEHHLAHAASAFYPSPFAEAAILTVDGVGEWATTTLGKGVDQTIEVRQELHFPHSLGLLYSAFTFYLGFKVNSGEYKLMGLAPYGHAESDQTALFKRQILEQLVDVREDGSFLLNMAYFGFADGLQMTRDRKWSALFGIPRRPPESALLQVHMNLALAIQGVTEAILLKLVATAKRVTGCDDLVMAGGVALNCVANAKILKTGLFRNVWIQPAAGDAGGALGAALSAYYLGSGRLAAEGPPRATGLGRDAMQGAYLGPQFSDRAIENALRKYGFSFQQPDPTDALLRQAAAKIAAGRIVGWFQGRMEFGPRALGNRSILADAGNPSVQQRLNQRIKFREAFRPFAPSVREEDAAVYFELEKPSPYMLLVASVNPDRRHPEPPGYAQLAWPERFSHVRSDVPSVTHVDYSARLHTVSGLTNPLFHQLLTVFKEISGCGVLVNTSFNVRGEPMVCTPDDALRCFLQTDMDDLVIGSFLLEKGAQSDQTKTHFGKPVFQPD